MAKVYDEEKTDGEIIRPKSDGSHDDLGVHPERREAEVDDLEKLNDAESGEKPFAPIGSTAESQEKSALGGAEESNAPWTTDVGQGAAGGASGGGLRKGLSNIAFNRKKALIGGIAGGGIIGVIFSVFTLLSGPLQFIHMAQMLQQFHFSDQEDIGDDRISKIARFVRYGGDTKRTRLTTIGNKMADKVELRLNENGIETLYSDRLAYFDGYGVDPVRYAEANGIKVEEVPEHFKENFKVDLTPDPEGGGKYIAEASNKFFADRSLTKGILKSTGYGKTMSAMKARLMGKRAAIDWHPMKKLDKAVLKEVDARLAKFKEDREKRINDGADDPDVKTDAPESEDADGEKKPASADAQDAKAKTDAEVQAAKEANADLKTGNPAEGGKYSAFRESTSLKFAGGVGAAIGLVCMINSIAKNIDNIKHANVVLPLMRMGMEAVTVGNQVMSGKDVDMEQLGFYSQQLNDPDSGSWTSARSIQAELGQEQSGPEIRDEAQVSSEKNLASKIIGQVPGIDGVCAAAGSAIGQVATFAVSFVGGPVTAIGGEAFGRAVLPKVIDGITNMIAGQPISTAVKGGDYGNYINYGARLAANDAFVAAGGVALNTADALSLKNQEKLAQKQDMESKSWAYKVFNAHDSRTIAGRIVDQQNPDVKQNFARVASSIPRNIGSIGSLFSSLMSRSAFAADGADYDYGFAKYGFSIDEVNNPAVKNPYDNAEKAATILEGPQGEMYKKRVKDCFGLDISPDASTKGGASVPAYSAMPPECSGDKSEEWLRVRFAIFDTQLGEAMACYEGVDAGACSAVGFGEDTTTTPAGSTDGSLGVSADGFVFPLKTTKETIIGDGWCYKNQNNCHHDYNAADIFAPTGTPVVAARGGTVISAKDHDDSNVGSRVQIKGDDGLLYYYAHMGDGTIVAVKGATVTAGQQIGQVGTNADAAGTAHHLHFDILPSSFNGRPACSGSACSSYPLINVQPALISAFEALP